MKQLTVEALDATKGRPPGNPSMVAEKGTICFKLWFRTHNNPRYEDLVPRLTDVVDFRKLTLSHRRFVRGVQFVSTGMDESSILRETGCGIVCKAPEDFAETLVELAQSAEKRAELGNGGRIYAKTHLDWSILIPMYRDILNGVVHGS